MANVLEQAQGLASQGGKRLKALAQEHAFELVTLGVLVEGVWENREKLLAELEKVNPAAAETAARFVREVEAIPARLRGERIIVDADQKPPQQ